MLSVLVSLFNGGKNLEISFGVRESNLEESEVKKEDWFIFFGSWGLKLRQWFKSLNDDVLQHLSLLEFTVTLWHQAQDTSLIYDRHTTTHPINICKDKEIMCLIFTPLNTHFVRIILHTPAYILQDLKFNPNAYRLKKELVFLCHAHLSHNDY